MTLLLVEVRKGSVDVHELSSQIAVWCFLLYIRHDFELRQSAAR